MRDLLLISDSKQINKSILDNLLLLFLHWLLQLLLLTIQPFIRQQIGTNHRMRHIDRRLELLVPLDDIFDYLGRKLVTIDDWVMADVHMA